MNGSSALCYTVPCRKTAGHPYNAGEPSDGHPPNNRTTTARKPSGNHKKPGGFFLFP
ncbi:hypothetical protein [Flavonifractor plautii]|uniref:hypothetical protein n=1 Tax=Flavonifractor plautii TaxID=292800 RepID=UPI00319E2696